MTSIAPHPQEFGTPTDDADRRDITINALFYNINEDKIEDFTHKGISDLQQGIVRTPLNPLITFRDDPLRCLRVIRFAARFGFNIEEGTFAALSSEVSRDGIQHKVSRERVGIELDKMLRHPNAAQAVHLLYTSGLFDVVFNPHDPVSLIRDAPEVAVDLAGRVSETMDSFQHGADPDERKHLFLGAALAAYRNTTFQDKKGKTFHEANHIIVESLKFPTKEAKTMVAVLESVDNFRDICRQTRAPTRKELGLALRKAAEHWKTAFLLALALENRETKSDQLAAYQSIFLMVKDLNLEGSWNDKPLVNVSNAVLVHNSFF